MLFGRALGGRFKNCMHFCEGSIATSRYARSVSTKQLIGAIAQDCGPATMAWCVGVSEGGRAFDLPWVRPLTLRYSETQLRPMRYFLVVDVQRDHSFDDLSDVAIWAELRLSDRGRADVTAYQSLDDMLADKKRKIGAFTVCKSRM